MSLRMKLATAMFVVLAPAAFAEDGLETIPVVDAYFSDAYRDCANAGLSTAETNLCRSAEQASWDGRLNGAYKGLMASRLLSSESRAKLKAAQKA
jgi:uncharacterized protein YecT (DUF1311 family)